MVAEKLGGARRDGLALSDEPAPSCKHKADHPDRIENDGEKGCHGSGRIGLLRAAR